MFQASTIFDACAGRPSAIRVKCHGFAVVDKPYRGAILCGDFIAEGGDFFDSVAYAFRL